MSNELKPAPCPHCGSTMLGDDSYMTHPKNDCFWSEWEFDQPNVAAWNRRATSGAASGEVVVPELEQPDNCGSYSESQMRFAYLDGYSAGRAPTEQSAPPVPRMGGITNEEILAAMRPELDEADGGYSCDTQPERVIAAGRALLATQSASTAPGQADWCPECHARESDGYEQALERDAARYRWLRSNAYIELSCDSPKDAGWSEQRLDESVDSAIAALSKEKP